MKILQRRISPERMQNCEAHWRKAKDVLEREIYPKQTVFPFSREEELDTVLDKIQTGSCSTTAAEREAKREAIKQIHTGYSYTLGKTKGFLVRHKEPFVLSVAAISFLAGFIPIQLLLTKIHEDFMDVAMFVGALLHLFTAGASTVVFMSFVDKYLKEAIAEFRVWYLKQ